jgi:hypothetical protein
MWQHFVIPLNMEAAVFVAASTNLTLITQYSRVLERPIVPQLVKKFHELCGTRRFVTALTTACHFFLS